MRRRNSRAAGCRALLAASIASALALGVLACGGDGGATGADEPPRGETATSGGDGYGFIDDVTGPHAKPASEEPKVRIAPGPPPRHLVLEELREGTGRAVEYGDQAVVNYVGYIHRTKRHYDTSYGDNAAPMKVVPGRGDFIDGFEEGIVGMRVGGLRKITIPPDKAYGEMGYPPDVDPGDTLVFVVKVEALQQRE